MTETPPTVPSPRERLLSLIGSLVRNPTIFEVMDAYGFDWFEWDPAPVGGYARARRAGIEVGEFFDLVGGPDAGSGDVTVAARLDLLDRLDRGLRAVRDAAGGL